jgi:hypothetical protein
MHDWMKRSLLGTALLFGTLTSAAGAQVTPSGYAALIQTRPQPKKPAEIPRLNAIDPKSAH